MLLTVKKQIEETVEVKTPCYYKGLTGYTYINEAGEVICVMDRMINMWSVSDGKHRDGEIERMLSNSKPCEKSEYDKKYAEVMAKLNIASGAVEF